jgi:hypothetical protein
LQLAGCGENALIEHAWCQEGQIFAIQTEAGSETEGRVEAELIELAKKPIDYLRQRRGALFQSEAPSTFGPDLLRRSIAYCIQENA